MAECSIDGCTNEGQFIRRYRRKDGEYRTALICVECDEAIIPAFDDTGRPPGGT